MSHAIKIDQFEGPLHLLLQLVEQEELEISTVSLAQVTDQYIEHVEHTTVPPEELADFLVIAAKLLYIKSRLLIPTLVLEPEDGLSLEEQLKMYKEFVAAGAQLERRLKEGNFSYSRERASVTAGVFSAPKSLTAEKLRTIFVEVIAALEPIVRLPKAAIARIVSIEERISELKQLLVTHAEISFGSFVRSATSTTDIVVSFLALLELMKQRSIRVEQGELFSDMTIGPGDRPISALIDITAI